MTVRPETMTPRLHRVASVHPETADTVTVTLEVGEAGTEFDPGQFLMAYAFGVGEIPLGFSGDPGTPDRIQFTVRSVGAVSAALHGLGEGSTVGLRGPFGTAWPAQAAEERDVIIIAGGIGLAPLRPLIYEVLANRDRYGNVCLLYGTRTPGEMLYREELAAWRGRFDAQVLVTVDQPTTNWHGHVGVVTSLLDHAIFDPLRATAFVCGPEIMMTFSAEALERRGVPQDQVYVSLERNMKCAIGFCGHCLFGPKFVCKEGPVFNYPRVRDLLTIREL